MAVDARIQKRFDETPVNRFLGYTLRVADPERVVIAMPVRAEFLQETGVVQGGIVSAIADTATAYLVVPHFTESEAAIGLEFKMNFLRPATVAGGEMEAEATLVRRGRRVVVSRADVRQGGKTIATGIFTYLITEVES